MSDFEVLPIGTIKELRLSRELVHEIEEVQKQYGGVIPQNVMNIYNKLLQHYAWEIENEML